MGVNSYPNDIDFSTNQGYMCFGTTMETGFFLLVLCTAAVFVVEDLDVVMNQSAFHKL